MLGEGSLFVVFFARSLGYRNVAKRSWKEYEFNRKI